MSYLTQVDPLCPAGHRLLFQCFEKTEAGARQALVRIFGAKGRRAVLVRGTHVPKGPGMTSWHGPWHYLKTGYRAYLPIREHPCGS